MTPGTWIQADAVVLPDRIAIGAAIRVQAGQIAEIAPSGSRPGAQRVSGTLLPGMVDLQVNGAGGADCATATDDALDTVARAVWQGGGAAFLPTLITQPFAPLQERLARVADWCRRRRAEPVADQAVPLGIHLEGPFLAEPGAHPVPDLLDPTPERIAELLASTGGELRLLTLANSRDGAAAATAQLRAAGCAVAMGHVTSTDGFAECVQAGARSVTHLFNAMGRLHHRDPGVAALAMDCAEILCPLIPDGVHVDPVMVRHAFRICGVDRLALVTDAMAAAGMPDGDYQLSGMAVTLKDGVVRKPDGTIAGAALTMAQGAERFLRFAPDAGLWSLARLTAANPTGLLEDAREGSAQGFGTIAVGAPARFTRCEGGRFEAVGF